MGTSCVGVRKPQPKKVQNRSNTISSEMNSHEEISLKKQKAVEISSLKIPVFHLQIHQMNLPVLLPSTCIIHREYYYHEYIGFKSEGNFPSHIINFGQFKEKRERTQNWRICTTLQREMWQLRGKVMIANGHSNFAVEQGREQSEIRQMPIKLNKNKLDQKQMALQTKQQIHRSFLPHRVVVLRGDIDNEDVKITSNCFQIKDSKDIHTIQTQIISIHPVSQYFCTPWASGVIFTKVSDKTVNLRWISQLLRVQSQLCSQFHLLIYLNPINEHKIPDQIQQCLLESYFQIAFWLRYIYTSIWQTDLKNTQKHIAQEHLNAYLSVQFLRFVLDGYEATWIKTENKKQESITAKRTALLHDFLMLEPKFIKSIYLVANIFLLLQDYPKDQIESKIAKIIKSITEQAILIADGLFHEFGYEINQKQHAYRNESNCFLKYKTLNPKKPLKIIHKHIFYPDAYLVTRIHLVLQRICQLHETITSSQITKMNEDFIQLIQSCYSSQKDASSPSQQVKLIFVQDYLVRISLLRYFFQIATGEINEKAWKDIVQQVTSLQMISPQSILLFFTLAAMNHSATKTATERTFSEEFYYLKALEMAYRLYGDPRANRASLPIHPEQVWELLILQNFCPLYSKQSIDRREYHFLNNILECLREDIKEILPKLNPVLDLNDQFYKKNLRNIAQFCPARRLSGYFFRRTDIWDFERQDSSSNFSDSQSSSGTKRLSKTSYKINEWQFSTKLTSFVGVIRWGQNIAAPPHVLPALKNKQVLCIQSGNYHTVFLTEEGIFGWGQNHSGQLGSHNVEKIYLKEVVNIKIVSIDRHRDKWQISCGNEHTAVLINGLLHMWGQKEGGILSGDGAIFDYVACGGLHTLAIRDGLVYSWGRGEGGQLGHPLNHLKQKTKQQSTEYFIDVPMHLKGISSAVIKVACGDAHSLVLTVEGKVYVFGFCYQGQLGLGVTGESQTFQIFQPVDQNFFKQRVVDVWSGPTFSFFKTQKQEVFSCGMNDCLQLGIDRVMKIFIKKKYINRTVDPNRKRLGEQQFSKPRRIDMFNANVKLSLRHLECGENHCLAIVNYEGDEQMVMGWGLNKHYQIDSQLNQNTTPRTLDGLFSLPVSQICCGSTFSLANIGKFPITKGEVEKCLNECLDQLRKIWSQDPNNY